MPPKGPIPGNVPWSTRFTFSLGEKILTPPLKSGVKILDPPKVMGKILYRPKSGEEGFKPSKTLKRQGVKKSNK